MSEPESILSSEPGFNSGSASEGAASTDKQNNVFRPRWLPLLWLLPPVLLSLVLVPRGADLSTRILGHSASDLTKHYWNLWWFSAELRAGQLPFSTHLLNFPDGLKLYPIEPLNMLAALVLTPLLGLAVTTNLLGIGNLLLACLGMYLLVRHLVGHLVPSFAAGLLYGLSAYGAWTLYVGVGELSQLVFLPLALRAMLRVMARGGWRRQLEALLWCTLTALSCWYYALFLFMCIGVVSGLYLLVPGLMLPAPLAPAPQASAPQASAQQAGALRLRIWGRTLLPPLLTLLVLLPILGAFNQSYARLERSTEPLLTYVQVRLSAPPYDNPETRIDLEQLFTGGADARARAVKNPYVGGRFLGFVLPLLALCGLLLRPRLALAWALLAGLALALGLGSRLVLGGLELGGRLPFQAFNLVLERLSQPMNFPARFMMPLTLAAVVLAGQGLSALYEAAQARVQRFPGGSAESRRLERMRASLPALLTLGLMALSLLELFFRGDVPLPLPARTVQAEPVAAVLRGLPIQGAILELPQLFQRNNRHAGDQVLLNQIVHGRATSSLPLDRITMFASSARESLGQEPLVRAVMGLGGQGALLGEGCCGQETLSDERLHQSRDNLEQLGFAYLIVAPGEMPGVELDRLKERLRQVLGGPVFQDERSLVFALASH